MNDELLRGARFRRAKVVLAFATRAGRDRNRYRAIAGVEEDEDGQNRLISTRNLDRDPFRKCRLLPAGIRRLRRNDGRIGIHLRSINRKHCHCTADHHVLHTTHLALGVIVDTEVCNATDRNWCRVEIVWLVNIDSCVANTTTRRVSGDVYHHQVPAIFKDAHQEHQEQAKHNGRFDQCCAAASLTNRSNTHIELPTGIKLKLSQERLPTWHVGCHAEWVVHEHSPVDRKADCVWLNQPETGPKNFLLQCWNRLGSSIWIQV